VARRQHRLRRVRPLLSMRQISLSMRSNGSFAKAKVGIKPGRGD
jgi:hypothetical protein